MKSYNDNTGITDGMLNSNIRCIEIILLVTKLLMFLGWIVTLDVLKWKTAWHTKKWKRCWIVTLDVLKFAYAKVTVNGVSVE